MDGQATDSLTTLDIATSRLSGVIESLGIQAPIETRQAYLEVLVPAERLQEVSTALRDRLGYRYLSMVTAVDYPDRLQVIYLAFTLEHPHGVFLKADLSRDGIPDC